LSVPSPILRCITVALSCELHPKSSANFFARHLHSMHLLDIHVACCQLLAWSFLQSHAIRDSITDPSDGTIITRSSNEGGVFETQIIPGSQITENVFETQIMAGSGGSTGSVLVVMSLNCEPWDEYVDCLDHAGSGGFGSVALGAYDKECRDRTHKDGDKIDVAIKGMTVAGGRSILKTIALNEIRTMELLTSPYFVAIWDSYYDDGERSDTSENDVVYILEEGLAGDLKDASTMGFGGAPLNEKNMSLLFLDVLRGVYHMHYNHSLVHRDLKPDNIMVSKDGRAKIGDVALSCDPAGVHSTIIPCQDFAGTPFYQAPEIWDARNGLYETKVFVGSELPSGAESDETPTYSTKSDMWSLGVILYQLVFQSLHVPKQLYKAKTTGRHPLSDAVGAFRVEDDVQDEEVAARLGQVDPAVKLLLIGLLQADPGKRFDVEEALQRTMDWVKGVDATDLNNQPPPPDGRRPECFKPLWK